MTSNARQQTKRKLKVTQKNAGKKVMGGTFGQEVVFCFKSEQKRLIFTIKMRRLKCLVHIVRKGSLKNLKLTGHTEAMRCKGKKRISCLTCLYKWIAEQGLGKMVSGQTLQRSRKLWRENTNHHLSGYGTSKKKTTPELLIKQRSIF